MTSIEDDKNRSVQPPPFQGASNYPQQPPAGYPQPAQPYVSGYAVNGLTEEQRRLPCCGIGIDSSLVSSSVLSPGTLASSFYYALEIRRALSLIVSLHRHLSALSLLSVSFELISLELDLSLEMGAFRFHQYQVVGRALPTEKDVQPKIYRMKLWASNEVRAKSKFWYFLRKLKKVKKSNGQMLAINEIFEKSPTKIKNYGIWLRYQSRTGYHNMYKEFRDTTLNGAVEQMYTEMASRHRVRFPCIQIIKTATVPASLCKRESTKQFHNSKIKFPLVFRKVRPPTRKLKTTYKASKPNLFM
ncbi:hypothetical protein YC2023_030201 [Brassica napus]